MTPLGRPWIGGILVAASLLALIVTPVLAADPAALSNAGVSPRSGDLGTRFTFVVTYTDPAGRRPDAIRVVVGGQPHRLRRVSGHDERRGVVYRWSGQLPKGEHAVAFEARSDAGLDISLVAGSVRVGPPPARADPQAPAEPTPKPKPKPTPTPTQRPQPKPTVTSVAKPTAKPEAKPVAAPRVTPTPTPDTLVRVVVPRLEPDDSPPDQPSGSPAASPTPSDPVTALVPGATGGGTTGPGDGTGSGWRRCRPGRPVRWWRRRRPDVGPARQPDSRAWASGHPPCRSCRSCRPS